MFYFISHQQQNAIDAVVPFFAFVRNVHLQRHIYLYKYGGLFPFSAKAIVFLW